MKGKVSTPSTLFPAQTGGGLFSRIASASWGDLLRFDLLLLAFLILGTRLATLLHEFLGHAFAVMLSGGGVNAVRVSLLGGGQVLHNLPDVAGTPVRVFVALSGIAVNLITGALVLYRFRRPSNGRLLSGFWILFAGASLLGGTAYAALGFYYGQGDPVAWMERGSDSLAWASIPFLTAAPFLGYAAVKAFSEWIAHWFPSKSFSGRLIILVLTAGAVAAAYAGLYQATGARSRAMDAPQAAFVEAKRQVVQAKEEALAEHLRRTSPNLSEDRILKIVKRTPIEVRPEEVPRKFPLKAALAFLYAFGGAASLYRSRPPGPGRRGLTDGALILAVAIAAVVLTALAVTGGWLYRAPGFPP